MKYLSLFSGIGGFELGIQQAYEDTNVPISTRSEQRGVDDEKCSSINDDKSVVTQQPNCIGYSEIDKYAIQVYNKQFNHKNYGDITKIKTEELPDFDLVVGGFPCQSFSIAGKRAGFDDPRGNMFFEIARIIREKQPRLLLFENVKGLLSHDKGATFYTIISTLDELGYDCQWQVLNSKNFGVPQNRERVFIVGHLRGTSRPEVFPIGEGNEPINKMSGGSGWTKPETTISGCIGTKQDRQHNTFIANDEIKIRRLTPKECERLQGFPDNWTRVGLDHTGDIVDISDTQRYKMCGNAVTVNVIKEIMLKLL